MVMHRVRRIPITGRERDSYRAGARGFRRGFTYLGYIPQADFFGERELAPKSRARGRARAQLQW